MAREILLCILGLRGSATARGVDFLLYVASSVNCPDNVEGVCKLATLAANPTHNCPPHCSYFVRKEIASRIQAPFAAGQHSWYHGTLATLWVSGPCRSGVNMPGLPPSSPVAATSVPLMAATVSDQGIAHFLGGVFVRGGSTYHKPYPLGVSPPPKEDDPQYPPVGVVVGAGAVGALTGECFVFFASRA